MKYLLGLDAGTTAIKGILFNEEGKSVAQGSFEYNLETPKSDFVELNPHIYWEATKKVIRQTLGKSKIEPEKIKALAISSQGETLICLDKKGNPLRKAIVWLDNRSKKEAEDIKKEFGVKEIYQITGQPEVVPTWPATKILWIRRNEAHIFKNVFKYLLVEDYLIYKFTGRFVTEGSVVSSSLMFNIREGRWWDDILKFIGISSDLLPTLMESGKIVSQLSKRAVKEIGLSSNTLIITGAFDHAAGSIGAGNIAPGIITEMTGGALAICATIKKPIFDPLRRVPCQYHAIRNRYFLLPWCQTAGMVLKWFRDEFCQEEVKLARKKRMDVYDILTEKAEKIAPGSEGLIMLPHLSGTACPEFNPSAKGVWFGFTLKHTKAHFIRSIMEAIAYMLKGNIKLLENLGVKVEEIRSLGGGAKSRLWCQIKADTIQKPIITLKESESACLGAAILAGIGSNIFKNFEEATEKMVRLKEKILPQSKNFKLYEKNYQSYLCIYQNLNDSF